MRRLAPIGVARHVRAVSGIALEAAQVERGLQGDHAPDMDGRFSRLRARPPSAHVHVHEDVEHLARGGHGLAELANIVRIVHHHQRLRRLLEHAHQTADLLGPHYFRGDEHVADARRRHHLGFAHLGAADAHRARGDLSARDLRTLVGLGVRPDLLPRRLHIRGHLGDVPLEAVQVEEEGGGGDLVPVHDVGEHTTARCDQLGVS